MTRLEASSGLTKVLPPNKITFLSEFIYDLYCRGFLDGPSLSSAPKVSTLILLWETHRTSISIPRLVWSAFLGVFYFFECGMAFKCTVSAPLYLPEHAASAEQASRQVVLRVSLRPLRRPHREGQPRLLARLPGRARQPRTRNQGTYTQSTQYSL